MSAHAYERGWHTGRLWAERDLANGSACDAQAEEIRAAALSLLHNVPRSQAGRRYIAEELGQARGYRQTVADYHAGRVDRQTFELMTTRGERP